MEYGFRSDRTTRLSKFKETWGDEKDRHSLSIHLDKESAFAHICQMLVPQTNLETQKCYFLLSNANNRSRH